VGDYLDPTTFLDLLRRNAPNNATGWSSAEFERLLDAAARTIEPARRHIRNQHARATIPPTRQVANRMSREVRMSRLPATYEIPAKLGQTWARKRAFSPKQR
jgi:hypothetical protein